MFFHPKTLKSENNNPWFKPWFNILLHTQPIVCATVESKYLEYLGYITLFGHLNHGLSNNICFSDRKPHVFKTPDLIGILQKCESQHDSNCNQNSDQKPTKVGHGSWLILLLTLYRFSTAVCFYCDNSDWTSFKNYSRRRHPPVFWKGLCILLAQNSLIECHTLW